MAAGDFARSYVAQQQVDYGWEGQDYGAPEALDYLECTAVAYNDAYVSGGWREPTARRALRPVKTVPRPRRTRPRSRGRVSAAVPAADEGASRVHDGRGRGRRRVHDGRGRGRGRDCVRGGRSRGQGRHPPGRTRP